MSAIGRYLRWQIQSRIHDEIQFNWIGGSKLLVRNGMTGATGNIYCGLHEFVDMAFMLHLVRPGELFLDVGANIGSYTVLAAAVLHARVLAVEPDPESLAGLRRNVELNAISDRVRIAEVAVGEVEGSVSFTVGLDTMNKIAEAGGQGTRTVGLSTLDRLVGGDAPTMIKLDVEGFEYGALAGAKALLARDSLIAIESEGRDAGTLDLLHCAGFEEMFYDPFCRTLLRTPSWPQSNGLFVRRAQEVQMRVASAERFSVLGHTL